MIEYGISTTVRSNPRPRMILAIARAIRKPRTSSTTTVTMVMNAVVPKACHQSGSRRMIR